jgi:dihydropteroate synthase
VSFASRARYEWKLRTRVLSLGEKTVVMGVLNTTPDSFSDGGQFAGAAAAIEHGLAMFEEGADIVDIGGESTRPGKRKPVVLEEELDRVLPVIEGILRHRRGGILSIDTYKSQTAEAALAVGVEIVNDVSGLLWDEAMAAVCAGAKCGVVLMHTRGRPEDWKTLPGLKPEEVVPHVQQALQQRLEHALGSGIEPDRIAVDPGFGFGILGPENYSLLAGLDHLSSLGRPLLAGPSRKRFLAPDLQPAQRGNATLAATTAAILNGAHVVRVHDVRAVREAATVADAVLMGQEGIWEYPRLDLRLD